MHTAIWTGTHMLIWGGGLSTGGRYALGDTIDDDGDGLSECAGDCNDADAGAFAFPPEIANLTFTDKVTLNWDSAAAAAGSATVHDIVIGLLSEGPVGGRRDLHASPG
ncbi:MAG: hypothetical protein V3S47_02240 [Acidobacteriota bacterium]